MLVQGELRAVRVVRKRSIRWGGPGAGLPDAALAVAGSAKLASVSAELARSKEESVAARLVRTLLVTANMSSQVCGALIGTAIGDSVGLPTEGLSRRRLARWGLEPLRQRLFFGRGMVSDDTDHSCLVAEAILAAEGDPARFRRALAKRLKIWFLTLPAGIGWGTGRALMRLLIGFSPERSGVQSAGNGPAMRSGLIGAYFRNEPERLKAFVNASTRLTHADPRAEAGALAIAWAARHGALQGPDGVDAEVLLAELLDLMQADRELCIALISARAHLARLASASEFANSLGLQNGVTGYVHHSVPVALYCFLRYPGDYRTAVTSVIRLGGDTDTTGAIVGALSGATVGHHEIPSEWRNNLSEWPRSLRWMEAMGAALDGRGGPPPPASYPALLLRNLFFLMVVLGHAFRRLLPPY